MTTRPSRMSPTVLLIIAVAGLLFHASISRADSIIDLTSATVPVQNQGAIFAQTNQQPAGTGVFSPFVRIQTNGTEAGYNTDARPVEFETKDQNQWTHSLPLNSLQSVNINGVQYYQFTLDINEKGNEPGSLLSMDDFRIYLGNSGSLTGFNDGFGANSVKVFDLDAAGQVTVNLNADLNPPGSGVADLNVYVPVSNFDGKPSQYGYVYLYSSFGSPYPSDAGFEEWSSLNKSGQSPSPVPAPGGLLLGLIGAGCFVGRHLRRKLPAA